MQFTSINSQLTAACNLMKIFLINSLLFNHPLIYSFNHLFYKSFIRWSVCRAKKDIDFYIIYVNKGFVIFWFIIHFSDQVHFNNPSNILTGSALAPFFLLTSLNICHIIHFVQLSIFDLMFPCSSFSFSNFLFDIFLIISYNFVSNGDCHSC